MNKYTDRPCNSQAVNKSNIPPHAMRPTSTDFLMNWDRVSQSCNILRLAYSHSSRSGVIVT